MSDIHDEARKIAEKYQDKPEVVNKMDMLRRLDESATKMPSVISLIIGIVGALILGVGMCFTMVWTDFFALGIAVGIIGIVVCAVNYPIFKKMVAAKKAEIAPQILQLSNEIMENSEQ